MYDFSNSTSGAKPPKEMRTVRRDGDIVTEDYERLNPDGTVTKTITKTDEKTGQKHVSVYKMDKSGIVRKVEDVDPKLWTEAIENKAAILQNLKDRITESAKREEEIKEHYNKPNSNSVVYENVIPSHGHGISYSKNPEEDEPDKHEMAYNLRNINKPINLTPKQQVMVKEHKENILNYGTQKLIKQLNKKLSEDKFNEAYPLTDEQKDKVIEYGIRKFHKLLEKNLDDERLIYDVMSFNPDFGEVDLSGRGTRQIPGDQSVSFSLNPYDNITQQDIAKPVSFSMRPEKSAKPLLAQSNQQNEEKVNNNGYKNLWNDIMNIGKIVKKIGHRNDDEKISNNEKNEESYENYDSELNKELKEDKEKDDYKKLKNSVKKLIQEDDVYKRSSLTQEEKDDVVNYALKQVRSLLKDTDKEKEKSSPKKKINLSNYFDEDEIYDYGRRVLKRLVRRSLKAFDIDQDMLEPEKNEDPELTERRDAFFQYLGDIVEGRVKESDPLPLIKSKKQKLKDEQEDEPKWDYQTLLSNIFSRKKKDETPEVEVKPKKQQKQLNDIDSLLSWFQSDKEDRADTEKVSTQQSENVPKVKPRFYQLEPETNSASEKDQTQSEHKGFDLKSLLQKIQEAAVKKFQEPKTTELNENTRRSSVTQEQQPSMNENNNANAHYRKLTQAEIDSAFNQIRQNDNEASNSKNKPPYLKERISGLSSIPRPKITSVSPSDRKVDFSDHVSFQLKPHSYENTENQQEKSRTFENQQIESAKPCSHEQDFQPWWFESPENFMKKAFTGKPLMKDRFIDSPMINSSFSTNGNKFSTAGSFLPGNMLE